MSEPRSAAEERARLSLDELVRLRWATVAGQAVAIGVAQATLADLPLLRLAGLVATLAVSNLLLALWRDRWGSPRALCGAALSLDTLLLTGLLHATGGAYNPFSVLFLVHITLAAVVLGARWTWFLAGLSVACYGLLFQAQPMEHAGHGGSGFNLHLRGMWVAFVVAAALIAQAVVKLCAALERRDAEVLEMRERMARQQRLTSVTTLAAGAAHELGTPLATIAVASKELERAIRGLPEPSASRLAGDAALIRSELERCRSILHRLAADAGQAPGEAPVEVEVEDVLADILRGLAPTQRARLQAASPRSGGVRVARGALVQVAQSLLQNAFEAGPGPVALTLETDGSQLRLRVRDEGSGMPPEVLARVGEPFFSTRGAGRGLGLGVFIARSLSEQMGGALRLASQPGRGTTATVEVPLGHAA